MNLSRDAITERLESGDTLGEIAREQGVPKTQMYKYYGEVSKETKIKQATAMVDRAMEELGDAEVRALQSDDPTRARIITDVARQRAELLKWRAERQSRSDWGNKVSHEHEVGGKVSFQISDG